MVSRNTYSAVKKGDTEAGSNAEEKQGPLTLSEGIIIRVMRRGGGGNAVVGGESALEEIGSKGAPIAGAGFGGLSGAALQIAVRGE